MKPAKKVLEGGDSSLNSLGMNAGSESSAASQSTVAFRNESARRRKTRSAPRLQTSAVHTIHARGISSNEEPPGHDNIGSGRQGSSAGRKKTSTREAEPLSTTPIDDVSRVLAEDSRAGCSGGEPGKASTRKSSLDAVASPALADAIAAIREHHRQREDFHNAEKRLTNQIKAIERRLAGVQQTNGDRGGFDAGEATRPGQDEDENPGHGTVGAGRVAGQGRDANHLQTARGGDHGVSDDPQKLVADKESGAGGSLNIHSSGAPDFSQFATAPLADARAYLKKYRIHHERRLEDLAEKLPVWGQWAEGIPGIGGLGLAQIIAETGDLSNYSTVSKVWKRMGLAVIDGERQRKCRDVEKALRHGFNPRRRAIMFIVGDCLVKQNQVVVPGVFETTEDGKQRKLRKPGEYRALYLERKGIEAERSPSASKMHVHRRAQRYMEKRLLRDLWRAWRDIAVWERGRAESAQAIRTLHCWGGDHRECDGPPEFTCSCPCHVESPSLPSVS